MVEARVSGPAQWRRVLVVCIVGLAAGCAAENAAENAPITAGTGGPMAGGAGMEAGTVASGTGGAAAPGGTGGGIAGMNVGGMDAPPPTGGSGGTGGGDTDGGTPPDDSGMTDPPPPSGEVDPVGNDNRAPGFVNLAPAMGEPLPMMGMSVTPAPPAGWAWYEIDGAICRDGSKTGFYVRRGAGDGLVIYLEGGGACSNGNYCSFNPANVNSVLAGDGQVVIGSAIGAGPGRQQPGVYTDPSHVGAPAGMFDFTNAENPYKDWSAVYVPYCTGDVHFGTRMDGKVPNLAAPQHFVGYNNMLKFMSRIVPTFKDSITRAVITGASAGGFGAALNFSMVQDSFGNVPVYVVDDSGPPFDDKFMPPCMQKRWREAWGFNGSLPPDCDECRQADGAGLVKLADFLMRKHPKARIAMISSTQDEVIRLFYSVGLVNCANYDTADPVAVVLLQFDPMVFFPGQQYTDGLNKLRTDYTDTGQLATYYMGGGNITFHQHVFRQRFYESAAGGMSIAKFVSDFIGGKVQHVGP